MPVSSWVDSVEFINATISGSNNSSSYALSKGQDYTHCIPFFTVCGDSTYWDNRLTDVYFSGTTQSGIINFARSNNRATSNYIKCYVVEFNPTKVRVQQGTFSLTGATSQTVTLPTTVSGIDRVAMTFGWQSNDAVQYMQRVAVRGRVVNTTSIDFYRNSSTSNCSGHWFLFEDLGDNFRVNHLDSSHAATGQTLNISDPKTVDPLRTFVLGSYATSGVDAGFSTEWTTRLFLYSIGTVRSDRSSASYNIYWAVQVVEILDQTKVYTPMDLALVGWTSPTTYVRNVAGVSGRVPFLCNPQTSTIATAMMQGTARVDASATAANSSCMVASEITASGTITYTKYGTSYAAYPSYTTAVDWAGITVVSGSNLYPIPKGNGPNQSFVKSVENFRFTLSGGTGAYVLTKGQVVSNCAIFSSNRGTGTNALNVMVVNVFLKEPGIVYFQHWDDSNQAIIDVSVVEFYPDQVKVQQKIVNIDITATTVNVPIEAVSSINKAFILSSVFTPNSGTASSVRYSFYRISFTSTTNVELYKYIAGYETVCTLFIVEDLQNNFVTAHTSRTFGTATDNFYDDTYNWGFHNSFPIVTYTTSEVDNYPQNAAIRCLYISPLRPVYCSRGSGSYNIYSTMTIVKFIDNKRHTQPIARDLVGATATVTDYYHSELRGTENITAFNPVQYSTIHCASTAAVGCVESFGTIRIINYTTGEYEISKAGATYSCYFGGHFINWPGFHYQIANNITGTRTKSFINSIQKDSFNTSDGWLEVWLRYNQDITKCVPFITNSVIVSDNHLTRMYKNVFRYSNPDCFRICFGSNHTSTRKVLSSIVEFNQDIKVQHGSGYSASTSKTFAIEQVNLNRAFLHFFSHTDSWVTAQKSHAVCGRFTSSSEITFIRDSAIGTMHISWYVVECPDWGADSYWTVYRNFSTSLGSAATLNAWLPNQPSLSRTIYFASYTTNETDSSPYYAAWRISNRQDHGIQMDKSSTGYAMQAFNVEAIEFSSAIAAKGLKVYSNYYTLGGTTTVGDIDLMLNSYDNFNVKRSIITQAYSQNLTRVDTSSVTGFQEGFHYLEFKDDNSDGYSNIITAYRGTASYSSSGFYYAIQFPEYNKYYFSGYVTEQGLPVSRKVIAYKSSSGEMTDYTTSNSGTGYFYLETASYEPHHIVAMDDDGGVSFNNLIYGKIYPATISGAFAWATDYLTVSGTGELAI